MRRLAGALAFGIVALTLAATPAAALPAALADELVYAVLPLTPAQATEVAALVRTPGTVAVDLVEVTGAVAEAVPALPAALVHDIVTAPIRDWHILKGIVVDTVELVAPREGERRGVFRHTLRALHRSETFGAAARLVRRVTAPSNRTARLAIVLAARAQGVPARAEHLDQLHRALDRDDPDLGPLLLGVLDGLARAYGRDAVRLVLLAD
jgi:hypothetical protein